MTNPQRRLLPSTLRGISMAFIWFMISSAHAGSWQQHVAIGGFNNVHIYTPDGVSPVGNGKALLIVLHGCTQPIDAFLTANLEDAADASGMVIAVPDAMHKAGFSCWSYWQGAVSRTAADYANLIALAQTMGNDPNRNIDPSQVYISGLSSGGAFAAQASCLAPDIFAGTAPSAGPTLGTSSNGALGSCEVVSPALFKSRCEGYAGSNSGFLSTQIAVVAQGNADTTVDTCYNQQNADGFADVYGVAALPGVTTLSEGPGHTAELRQWQDGRVAMLWLDNLGHTWSGGAGASGSYVGNQSVNFAAFLGSHFAANNLRVERNQAPELADVVVSSNGNRIVVSGSASDTDGYVATVTVTIYNLQPLLDGISDTPALATTISASVAASGMFSEISDILADGLHEVVILATDNEARDSASVRVIQQVGPEPAPTAPVLGNVNAAVAAQCVTLTGTVFDPNLDLESVAVSFSTGPGTVTVDGYRFSTEQCDLPGGLNTATVTATDVGDLSSTSSITFTIDAGSTGDYNFHIGKGHISWGDGFSACYLAFSVAPFTMRETVTGADQCEWVADGAPACNGPLQACAGSNGTDSDADGIDDAADNCPEHANPDQADNDNDGMGNPCDATPDGNGSSDTDGDGVADAADNCPSEANADQLDNDNDGIGNVCDSTPDGSSACEETRTFNFYHKSAGRAYSVGNIFAPVYYAYGTDELMPGSTWGVTTLLSTTSGNTWSLGSCP